MKHEQLLKEIEQQLGKNRINLGVCFGNSERVNLRENNNLLGKIKTVLKDAGNEYERGCEDAWELARKLFLSVSDGGFGSTEREKIFDKFYATDVIKELAYKEALAKVEAYEKKKKEEAEKPVIGDVVECDGGDCFKFKGILIGESDFTYEVMTKDDKLAQLVQKDSVWSVKKTDQHFDIQGMLDEIKN